MSSSGRRRYNLRSMDSVFQEFQEVFGGSEDEQQSERERTQEDARRSRRKRRRPMIADSSPEPQDQRTDRNNQQQQQDDAPAWANRLLRSQQDAMQRNEQELHKLRKEVRSLKRKREETSEDYQWKFKGNKRQHRFNSSLQDKFQEIAEANTLLEARTVAEEGLSLLSERNKHIKIADRDGWDTVDLYVNDPLAIDDEDEKKIRRAKKEAERLRETKRKEKESRPQRSRQFGNPSFATKRRDGGATTSGARGNQSERFAQFSSTPSRKYSFRCFRCQKPGHYQKDCTAPFGNQ